MLVASRFIESPVSPGRLISPYRPIYVVVVVLVHCELPDRSAVTEVIEFAEIVWNVPGLMAFELVEID